MVTRFACQKILFYDLIKRKYNSQTLAFLQNFSTRFLGNIKYVIIYSFTYNSKKNKLADN